MPRKNKRKFFGGKSKKSKTVKLNDDEEEDASSIKLDSNSTLQDSDNEEREFKLRKSAVHSSISSVSNDSTVSSPEANATKMGAKLSSSPRWCSEPNLTNNGALAKQQRATIQLKIIQFIGNSSVSEEQEIHEIVEEEVAPKEEENLHEDEAAGAVPKLDHYKEDEANEPQQKQQRSFDDNYRVESPKQISSLSHDLDDECRNRLKRHAMLIQEISESSSSEEVKQFLDNEASAIETKVNEEKIEKPYRVESPVSSDECNNKLSQSDEKNLAQTVHEICESSSSESVKSDEKSKIATLNLKIINIQELPTESKSNSSSTSPKAKIKLFECKSEKKLNKAEEAIIEALYGNANLLQIPNTPLDVISEEGSDYNSDIDTTKNKATADHDYEEDEDDDVFLKTTTTSAPVVSRFCRSKKVIASEPPQPLLINTKLIEAETNVPESCKKWETRQSDSELQAELVYLPSTSSSATDLSERSSTDTEDINDEDLSEDTETNSLLDNISVPPLTYNVTTIPTSAEQEHEHVYSTDQLPDIIEEDEDPKSIIESQQQIDDINKELHHLVSFAAEQRVENLGCGKEIETNVIARDDDDKKLISERQGNSKSGTPTPTQTRRKYSSDSSTSSSNSQCTIIRQVMPIENVHPLRDLCMQSLNDNNSSSEGKVTVQKRCNSLSRNAPNIPIINELELHYECDNDDLESREKKDKVITILQVPPEINNNQSNSSSRSSSEEKKRWFGMQSSQMPNLMLALSPSQKDYMMSSQDSNATTTSADVLLDMHKKFVERRAYHEASDDDDKSGLANDIQLENSNRSSNNGCLKSSSDESAIKLKIVESDVDNESSYSCRSSLVINGNKESNNNENRQEEESDTNNNNMNTIRNLILREKFFNVNNNNNEQEVTPTSDEFVVKKCELEDELIRLDYERKELEEELKNIQSLQHFKREEFLYNQRKLLEQEESKKIENETDHNRHSLNNGKYVNDDFSDFINSNEKLHKEIYNEWQDKVLERNERKLQKTLKITSINEITRDEQEQQLQPTFRRERAASERIIKLNDEFLERVKERQKRLSLPLDDNLDASTESLLNDQNEHDTAGAGARKKKKKIFHFNNKENFPAHFREFIEYCEQEIEVSKNSVESGIWSEQNRSEDSLEKKLDSPPPPPVWTPKSAPPSPLADRKFRPVPFESPTLQRRKHPSIESPSPPPWSQPDYPDKPYQPSIIKSSSLNTISAPRIKQQNHIVFRKARADQLNEKFDKGISLSPKDRSVTFKTASLKPSKSNELVYSIKQRDTSSEAKDRNNNSNNNNYTKTEEVTTRKMTTQQQSPKKVEGVGPLTKEGIPLSLRSEVTDESREQWYKKMYNTIHKAKDDGIPYKSNGYASEPDANYDSDYIVKYNGGSVDRQRTLSASNQSEERYGSMEQPVKPNASQYKNQPGRIENYTPGKSSVSDKEAKQWWDDIMEIFDGHLEQQKLASNYTQGNLSRALKDQGYQSDSTLVFKKKSDVEQLSPVQQKIAYKSFQHGGEVPLHGFRKHAPEKPKDLDSFTHSPTSPQPPLVPPKHNYNLSGYFSDSQKRYVENDVNIHYKVPVRYEFKHAIPDDELARQQAEHMKKVYQEERRRKYLQELQDMSNRRHTDNFTPSQKSPIALNRYDDFACEPPSKSPVNLPGTVARALYSFQGQSTRELSFKKGDIIYIRRQIDKNWYEGEHNAMIGLLPVQYVDIISNDGIRPPVRKPTEGQARAKYNFVAQSDIELSLNKGELVSLTRRVDANWFEGRIGNRKGIFPVSYVDVLTDIGSEDLENNLVTTTTTTVTKSFIPSTPSPINFSPNSDIVRETKTIRKTEVLHVDTANEPITYRAVYNYRPVNSDELELREGDLIYVLEQCDDGWFVGTNSRNGFFGTFPGNYVKRVY